MDRYMEQVMIGYTRENTLSADWLARLPLFLRLVQMQELLHYAQYLDKPDDEIQAAHQAVLKCVQIRVAFANEISTSIRDLEPVERPGHHRIAERSEHAGDRSRCGRD